MITFLYLCLLSNYTSLAENNSSTKSATEFAIVIFFIIAIAYDVGILKFLYFS